MDDEIFMAVLRTIDAERGAVINHLVGGAVKDYPGYRELIGKYNMLMVMEGEIKDMQKKFIDN